MFRTTLNPFVLGMFTIFACIGCSQEPNAENEVVDTSAAENRAADAENDTTVPTAGTAAENGDQSSAADEAAKGENTKAVCQLVSIGDSGVAGTVHFTKKGDTIEVRGEVTGLSPGKHGFHIHEKGDLSDKETGKSAGGHFNPTDQPHGRPSDEKRHVGDLGNIEANEDGKAEINIDDTVIKLNGPHSIVGRALVVHEKEDTFAQPTGDAGGRVAFGKVDAE